MIRGSCRYLFACDMSFGNTAVVLLKEAAPSARKNLLRDFFILMAYTYKRRKLYWPVDEGVRCDMSSVGKNIRRYREQKNLTQDALAENLHVTRQAVSNWETGKNQPDLDMLETVANALGVEPADLLRDRKREYPRFQTKVIIWVVALGIITLFLLADELFINPHLHEVLVTTYRGWLSYMYNTVVVMPICRVAAGMLVPAVVSLWYNVQPEGKAKTVLRIGAILMLIPMILTMLYLVPLSDPALSRFAAFILSDKTGLRKNIACLTLPFLSGLCLYPAFVRLKTAPPD